MMENPGSGSGIAGILMEDPGFQWKILDPDDCILDFDGNPRSGRANPGILMGNPGSGGENPGILMENPGPGREDPGI